MLKKKIALMLILAMMLQILPIHQNLVTIAQTSSPFYDGGDLFIKDPMNNVTWTQYKLENYVGSEIKMSIKRGTETYYFNRELWEEKRIVVYGDYSFLSNNFKNATGHLDAQGKYVEIKNKGYYAGGTGEYRYHGFDAVGNPYPNGDFPVDTASATKAADKKWIHRIWDVTNPYHYFSNGTARIANPSIYNKEAMKNNGKQEVIETREWIAKTLPFDITYSTTGNTEAYNFSHILTRPTTLLPGESGMWHYNSEYKTPFYQVFSLEPMEDKLVGSTPIDVEIVDIQSKDKKNGAVTDKVFTIKVVGTLKDEYMYDGIDENGTPDDVYRGAYPNREDVKSWKFTMRDQLTGNTIEMPGTFVGERNKGTATFTVTIPHSVYKDKILESDRTLVVNFTSVGTVTYHSDQTQSDQDSESAKSLFDKGETTKAPDLSFPIIEKEDPLSIDIDAPTEMLDTETFKFVDRSVLPKDTKRTLEINGEPLSQEDEALFLAGSYLFPLIEEDKVYTYSVHYDDGKVFKMDFSDYVVVYTTKPKAQFKVTGTFKENRTVTANTDVANVNSDYLKANATLNVTSFNASTTIGNNALIRYGTQTSTKLEYIVKGETGINMSMQVEAQVNPSKIERSDIPSGYFTSKVFNYNLFILPDYEPALIANVWNSVMTRNEKVDLYYDAASVDQDIISVSTYKIYYDTNGDDIPETLVKEGNYSAYTPYTPTKLGTYKMVFYAEETFGQPTLSQFITAADKRTFTLERTFLVENLAPMTKVYTDIEYDFPEADIIVLNDEGISRDLNNTIVAERVNWINGLRQTGILGNVQVWDLKTYVHERPGSTYVNSGNSYPPASVPYTSDGFTGILGRYNVTNNPYQVDNGYYKNVSTSKSVTEYDSNSGRADYARNATKWYVVRSYEQNGMGQLPSSKSYDDGNYRGTLNKGSSTVTSDNGPPSGGKSGDTYTRYTSWEVPYTGTVTGTTQVWQSNWVSYDDYTGYYSGTLYKNFKQSFTPVFRNAADKYLVYFANATINNLADIQSIKNKGTVKVILVGTTASKSQLAHDYYIDNTKPLADVMKEVSTIVSTNNPVINKQLLLVGEPFTLLKADYDEENDPLTPYGYQYVHDYAYYDNNTGLESGAKMMLGTNATDYTSTVKTAFSKPGKYMVYRQIKDTPTGMPAFSKESNTPSVEIYVHRKPIADFTLDWDYNSASGTYKTTWVDLSYDLDHQFSDVNRGIVGRKIMYRKTSGDNVWFYSIPDNLTAGTYELRYTVKDIEGVWSDEKVQSFTLSPEPPMQVNAEFKSTDGRYTLAGIPASEAIDIFSIKTEYHKAHQIKLKWSNAQNTTLMEGAVFLSESLPNNRKNSNAYHFYDQNFAILKEQPDGTYYISIEARSSSVPFVSEQVIQTVQVKTPVYVLGEVGDMVTGQNATLTATTGEYSDRVEVTLFHGTPYAQTMNMIRNPALTQSQNGYDVFKWELDYVIPEQIPEGVYQMRFVTQTANGNQAQSIMVGDVIAFGIETVSVQGYWNHWRGQTDIHGKTLANQPHRFLSYEKVKIKVKIKGVADQVSVRFDAALEAMTFTNSLGQTYRYADETGQNVAFPIQMKKSETEAQMWEIEYILPLCPQTLTWENQRLRQPYTMTITGRKGSAVKQLSVHDIDMTGNVYDLLYVQPSY